MSADGTKPPKGVMCCERTFKDWHHRSCPKGATVYRDGKPFCGTHDPVRRAARREASDRAWRERMTAEQRERDVRHARAAASRSVLDAAFALLDAVDRGEPADPSAVLDAARAARAAGVPR